MFKNRILLLLLVEILSAGCSQKNYVNYEAKKPVKVSINQKFEVAQTIENSDFYSDFFTANVARFLDSISSDNAIKYIPNYSFNKDEAVNYVMSGEIFTHEYNGNKGGISFKTYLYDTYGKKIIEDFGCLEQNPESTFCLAYDPKRTDEFLVEDFARNFRYSSLKYIVDLSNVLSPINLDKKLTSFSFNELISAPASFKDVAIDLSVLINNILVVNRRSYDRKVFRSVVDYHYYQNFTQKKKTKSDISIRGELIENSDQLIIELFFEGRDVKLVDTARLDTKIFLSKERILNNDYIEAMNKLSRFFIDFLIINTKA